MRKSVGSDQSDKLYAEARKQFCWSNQKLQWYLAELTLHIKRKGCRVDFENTSGV